MSKLPKNLAEQAQADSPDHKQPEVATVNQIVILVEKLEAAELKVKQLEEDLKEAVAKRDRLRDYELSGAILESGASSLTTHNGGLKVTVEQIYYPHVAKADMHRFEKWLINAGNAGIVQPKVQVALAKGDLEEAQAAVDLLTKHGYEVNYTPEIHWQTFRSFTKEQVSQGTELPDYFQYHSVNRAKIKRS